jgi:hypothetical protein
LAVLHEGNALRFPACNATSNGGLSEDAAAKREIGKGSMMAFTIGEIGGIVGLISAGIVWMDRYYKGRPVVSLTTQNESGQTLICIRITNTTPYDIAVIGSNVRPAIYCLTEDRETISLLQGQRGKVPQFMLKPTESKLLILIPLIINGVPLEIVKKRVDFWIQWRRGNATWLWQPPLAVCTSTDAIRLYGLSNNKAGF